MTPKGFPKNDSGGILGGISNGAPIVLRLAVKPTSSISKPQQTMDRQGAAAEIIVQGRHDPCIAPRIVPVAEAMCALVIYDAWLTQKGFTNQESGPEEWDWEQLDKAFNSVP